MDTFENLAVWKRSHALSIEIYRLLADCRDWGFKDQITRSANSIADNIAEGAERPGKAEYRQFVGYAKGSAGETRSQMRRAEALAYIPAADCHRLITNSKKSPACCTAFTGVWNKPAPSTSSSRLTSKFS